MKSNLKDVTFLILVRLDSIERLENIIITVKFLCKYFDTNIYIRESSSHNNKILSDILKKKIKYEYIEDKDPILYRTKNYNEMIVQVSTPFLAIWDTDIVPEKKTIIQCVEQLRKRHVDASYPYNGYCFNVSEIIREIFMDKEDICILHRHKNKMNLLYDQILYGGAIFINRQTYIAIGMENEIHYGWGNEDFDRHYRLIGLNKKIFRAEGYLFHLSHPRGVNSRFANNVNMKTSKKEISMLQNSSQTEILDYIKKNNKYSM